MASFYGENIYVRQSNYNYNNITNPIPSNNYYTYDLGTYTIPNYNTTSNGYSANTYSYLTEDKNIYQKTQQIPYNYNTNIPYSSNTVKYVQSTIEFPKQYQTMTANNYKNYQKTQISNDIFNNKVQQNTIQRANTIKAVNPIKRYNTAIKKPTKYIYYNSDGIPIPVENNNTFIDYNNYNNLINLKPKNIQNQLQTKNQINETAKVTKIQKENNQNLLNNIFYQNINDNNQLNSNQRYSNYVQYETIPTYNESTKNDNLLLINDINSNDNKRLFSQSAHFPSKTQKINNNFTLNENIQNKNENIITENRGSYANSQYNYLINIDNIQNGNQLIYENQPSDNKNYKIINNNDYPSTNPQEKTKIQENQNDDKYHSKKISDQLYTDTNQSAFYQKNGEIISNSNSKKYFRQTKTGPVTSYGYCQNQGHRNYMEDEGKVIENLNGDFNKILFCLFDGHGGGQVSKFLQENFANYMKKIFHSEDYINRFNQLFKIIDQDIRALNCPTVGSTGTIVFIERKDNKKYLYCANIGDSRCVLVSKDKVKRLSYDHRVADPEERNRILSNGGIIVNGRVYGILMLSRSFGDFLTKDFGTIVTPHVVKYEITQDDLYCVIASDGVWDVVKDNDCLFLPKMAKMGMDTGELSRRMVNEALKRKSKDNLSCFVISLN